MKLYRYIFIVLVIGLTTKAQAQTGAGFAGVDKVVCEKEPSIQIGVDAPGYCNYWTSNQPINDPNIPTPTVTPGNVGRHIYKLKRMYNTFDEEPEEDEVNVTKVRFDEITFDQTVIPADGKTVVNASLKMSYDDPPIPVRWEIAGESRGVSIVATDNLNLNQEIQVGTEPGEVTLRVYLADNDKCYYEQVMKLEDPVSDVTAEDADGEEGTRKASHGETLFFVNEQEGIQQALVTAVPLEGTSFTEGIPEWSGTGGTAPGFGNLNFLDNSSGSASFTANPSDKTVYIERVDPQKEESSLNFSVSAKSLIERVLPVRLGDRNDVSITYNGKSSSQRVERYNSPQLGLKKEVKIEVRGNIKRDFFKNNIVQRAINAAMGDSTISIGLVIEGRLGGAFTVSFDESKPNPSWQFGDQSAFAALLAKLEIKLKQNFGNYELSGVGRVQSSVRANFRINNGFVEVQFIVDPVSGVIAFSRKDKITGVSRSFNESYAFMDRYTGPWVAWFALPEL